MEGDYCVFFFFFSVKGENHITKFIGNTLKKVLNILWTQNWTHNKSKQVRSMQANFRLGRQVHEFHLESPGRDALLQQMNQSTYS